MRPISVSTCELFRIDRKVLPKLSHRLTLKLDAKPLKSLCFGKIRSNFGLFQCDCFFLLYGFFFCLSLFFLNIISLKCDQFPFIEIVKSKKEAGEEKKKYTHNTIQAIETWNLSLNKEMKWWNLPWADCWTLLKENKRKYLLESVEQNESSFNEHISTISGGDPCA